MKNESEFVNLVFFRSESKSSACLTLSQEQEATMAGWSVGLDAGILFPFASPQDEDNADKVTNSSGF